MIRLGNNKLDKKKSTRLRRARKLRMHVRNLDIHRLCVNRTSQHIYAQIISPDGASTLASASTLEKGVADLRKQPGKITCAEKVGELIAERAKKKGIERVAFDRGGFQYHGRIKALAEAVRNNGLKF